MEGHRRWRHRPFTLHRIHGHEPPWAPVIMYEDPLPAGEGVVAIEGAIAIGSIDGVVGLVDDDLVRTASSTY